MVVLESELEAAKQPGILREIIGADAKKLAQFGDNHSIGVLNESAVASRAGVAARAAIAVSGDPVVLLREKAA